MYTFVSASVLALDLARHPHGAAVADVVDRALALGPVYPPERAVGRSAARVRLQEVADRAVRMPDALRGAASAAAAGLEPEQMGPASRLLQSALMGRMDDLLELLQHHLREVERLPQPAVDVVLDRLVATWTASDLAADGADLQLLRSPWDLAVGELPPPLPAAPATGPLLALLEAVARCDREAWLALDQAHERQHDALAWSSLLHEATRQTVELRRTVDAARWQLSAVRAAHAAGHVRETCAPGAMMSVVAAVQVLCVVDVLPAAARDDLLEPCRRVLDCAL